MNDPTTAARLQELRDRRDAYLAAEIKTLQSQEYVVGNSGTGRRNRQADLEVIRDGIKQINTEIAQLEAQTSGRRRVYYVRPL